MRRVRRGEELPVDAIALVVDLAPLLGIGPQALPDYLEEFINTLAISADRPDERRVTATDLAYADFQTIEKTMTEGHPCIVANAGRLGFSAEDIERYAPEVGNHFRLAWVAARREDCDVATVSGVDYDAMLVDELGVETLADFDAVLRECGCEPDAYHYLPVHPWQWTEKVRKLYSADLADRRIVFVGESPRPVPGAAVDPYGLQLDQPPHPPLRQGCPVDREHGLHPGGHVGGLHAHHPR